jgi:DNA repair exonuclease SbcCD ATPase subunit
MNQDIAVVDLINLLIQEEQFRKFHELDKKEEKINIIIINQTDENRNNNQNINQNTNRRDKCDICGCRHDGEYMVKKGVIFKN